MRYILALFPPMLQGKIGAGIVCLILKITLIGWLPAQFWHLQH